MSDAPKISVLMAVHNGMPFLDGTIRSVLGQTWSDFELLVIDDGSTDETPRCARAVSDGRMRYHRLEKVGFCEALNFGLEAARAPWVARIDADDLALPERLAAQYEYMNRHPECIVLGCQCDEIDGEDRVIGRRTFPLSDVAVRWQMIFGCPLLHPGVIYRRRIVQSAGGYRPETWPAEDYQLWTRLVDHGTFANHPQTLMKYRIRRQSVTLSRTEEQIELCSRVAGDYARGFSPHVDRNAVSDLYHFYGYGRRPKHVSSPEMARTYLQIKQDFLRRFNAPSEELDARISQVQRNLRWYCLERAQKCWLRPWRAWGWFRLAGRFDREGGTLGKIVGRKMKKVFSRKPPSPFGRGGP